MYLGPEQTSIREGPQLGSHPDRAALPHQKKPWLTGSESFCSMFSIFINNPVLESNVARIYWVGKWRTRVSKRLLSSEPLSASHALLRLIRQANTSATPALSASASGHLSTHGPRGLTRFFAETHFYTYPQQQSQLPYPKLIPVLICFRARSIYHLTWELNAKTHMASRAPQREVFSCVIVIISRLAECLLSMYKALSTTCL